MSDGENVRRINDLLAEGFVKIETRLASAQTIAELFEVLLAGVENEFGVPFVWLTFLDDEKTASLVSLARTSAAMTNRFSVVSQPFLNDLLAGGMKPVLANQELKPFYRLLPPERKYFVRSIAVVPFTLDGQLIGTWNNADANPNRYEADMRTDLLEGLAAQLSRKLTQLAARPNKKNEIGDHHD